MDEKSDLERLYFETMGDLGQGLFADYFSELTRKRQSAVLISAVISILLYLTIITPVEGTIGGIKVAIDNISIIQKLTGLICVYFLVTYILSVAYDLEVYKFKLFPSKAKFIAYSKKLQELLVEHQKELDEYRKLTDEKLANRKEIKRQWDKI